MSDALWFVYRMLNDPPNTPRELKCVGCKVALAGVSLTGSGVIFALAKRNIKSNAYIGSFYGGIGTLVFGAGLVFLRFAYENHNENELLKMEWAKKIRSKRLENSKQKLTE